MGERFYLQSVTVFLESQENAGRFCKLEEELEREGIAFRILTADSLGEFPTGVVDKADVAPGALWITDSPQAASAAAELGGFVLIYYHPKNREAKFPEIRFGMEEPEDITVTYLDRIYRRYARIPWEILETERCLLRETTEEDVDFFYQIYQEPSITQFTEGLYPQIQEEKQYVREYIEKIYTFYEFGVWTVVQKRTGAVIGRAGFSYRAGYEDPELGFIIGVPWQRQGIAGEICRAILDYGVQELGFSRVQALVEPGNMASLALCARLGFRPEATVREQQREYLLLIWRKNTDIRDF